MSQWTWPWLRKKTPWIFHSWFSFLELILSYYLSGICLPSIFFLWMACFLMPCIFENIFCLPSPITRLSNAFLDHCHFCSDSMNCSNLFQVLSVVKMFEVRLIFFFLLVNNFFPAWMFTEFFFFKFDIIIERVYHTMTIHGICFVDFHQEHSVK